MPLTIVAVLIVLVTHRPVAAVHAVVVVAVESDVVELPVILAEETIDAGRIVALVLYCNCSY